MIQYLKNIWNAQRNAAALKQDMILLKQALDNEAAIRKQMISLGNWAQQLKSQLQDEQFQRNAYSCLTATLANEYYQLWIDEVCSGDEDRPPDSIKEAHMLRGVATNWMNADDVRLGKSLWEKRQRQEAKRLEQERHLKEAMR